MAYPRHGRRKPRYCNVPRYVTTDGPRAAELIELTGRELMPWQKDIMDGGLGRKADGRWSASRVLVVVSRQQGKGDIIMARQLYGLFILREPCQVYTAHEVKTAYVAFSRLVDTIKRCPELWAQVKQVDLSKGREGIVLKPRPDLDEVTGPEVRFLARTKGAGRGYSAQVVYVDEAYAAQEDHQAALAPLTLAQKDPQIWYASSHGMVYSTVLARLVKQGRAKTNKRLASYDWAPDLDKLDINNKHQWYDTCPALGYIVTLEALENLRHDLGDDEFLREAMGVGQYAEEDGGWELVPKPLWEELRDAASEIEGKKAFAIDVTPDRSYACISVAGFRADGQLHGEVTHHAEGTAWLPEVVERIREKWEPVGVFYDNRGPAASLDLKIDDLTELGAKEVAKACSSWQDECTGFNFRHRDDPRLNTAVAQARKKEYGDGSWFISRKAVEHDLTPLNSVILALYGVQNFKDPGMPWIW